ncbi:hypothetical protein Tco_1186158 [Tanacetum coccineum]
MAPATRRGPNTTPNNTNPNNNELQNRPSYELISMLFCRNSTNREGSHSSMGITDRNVQTASALFLRDFMKCQPLNPLKEISGLRLQPGGSRRWNQFSISVVVLLKNGLSLPPALCQRERCSQHITERFPKLTLICTKFVANETEKINKYISGLPDNIYGSVKSSRPKTLDETIELANDFMDQKPALYAEKDQLPNKN